MQTGQDMTGGPSKITDYLAIYAAGLSTIIFIWNVLRARPKYKVRLTAGTARNDGDFQIGVYISIQNPSAHTVHISNVSLLYPYTKASIRDRLSHIIRFKRLPRHIGWVHTSLSNYDVKDGCPLSLGAGKSHDIFLPQVVLEKVLEDSVTREIRAVAQDQLWRNTYSPRFAITWYDGERNLARGDNSGA